MGLFRRSKKGPRAPWPPPIREMPSAEAAGERLVLSMIPQGSWWESRSARHLRMRGELIPKAASPVAAYGPRPGAKQSTPVKIRTVNVEQELEAKFKAAQAKATKVGVENLTKEDIDGLSSAQLKELRGY